MEDVREHKAASYIRGYGEDHPSASDTSRATSQKRGSAEVKIVPYQVLLFKKLFRVLIIRCLSERRTFFDIEK